MSENNEIRVIAAKLEATCGMASQFPEDGLPEVAFLGRSNVGKSSLINALGGVNRLARTSKSPGRTQLLHFFRIKIRGPEGDKELYFVDFPGFGFAKVPKAVKRKWEDLVEDYFSKRDPLRGVMLLADSRREPKGEELWISQNYSHLEFILAVTKCDKLSRSQASAKRLSMAQDFALAKEQVIATSVLKGKRQGLAALTDQFYDWAVLVES